MRISDLKPDQMNPNKGTQRGRGMVEASLRELGAGRSILVDKDGRVIAGNKTLESWADIASDDDVLVIKTRGDKLVVVQREDLDLASDPKARRLSVADNRSAEIGLDWDAEVIAAIALEDDGALDGLFTGEELAGVVDELDYLDGAGDDHSGASPWDRMNGDAADGVIFTFGSITCRLPQSVYDMVEAEKPESDIGEWVEGIICAGINR